MTDITALRAHLKWSQSQMAECLGCDQSTIFRIEAGTLTQNRSVRRLRERLEVLIDDGRALPSMTVSDVVDLMVGRLPPAASSVVQPLSESA